MEEQGKDALLRRGVAEIIVEAQFVDLLERGTPLRLKMGFDPSAPDLHLGHAVGLRKLRQLQEMGHKVVVIVGDWTAQIGDPSGRSATRPMLTADQVSDNAESYLAQFFKIVDRDRTETRLQSDWFGPFTLTDVIKLTSQFTVAQFLARDDFSKRFKSNQPIAITELLYPLLQAYDSVAIESDVEFGGTDQRFNLLVGRDLQEKMGQRPQQCFLMPILPGTDGVQKMSKSLDNYIGIDEPPNEMYGKTMRLPDMASRPAGEERTIDAPALGMPYTQVNGAQSLILMYMDYLTDAPVQEIEEMKAALENESVNPMELKKRLARDLVTQFHGAQAAREAESHFEFTVQQRQVPDEVDTFVLPPAPELAGKRLSHILVEARLAASSTEARRLIDQGAVQIEGLPVTSNVAVESVDVPSVLRVGRRRLVRLVGSKG